MFRSFRVCAAVISMACAATAAHAQQDAAKDKSAKPAPAAPAAAAKPAATKPAGKPGAVVGRDWTKIDTNKDHYISPDEMEVWLKANGPDSK